MICSEVCSLTEAPLLSQLSGEEVGMMAALILVAVQKLRIVVFCKL